MVRWQIATDDDETCNIYKEWRLSVVDREHGGFIRAGYEAIPQNLVINIFFGMILFFIFIFVRKGAWDFGRIALMQRNEPKYKDVRDKSSSREKVFTVERDQEEWMYPPNYIKCDPLAEPEFHDDKLKDEGAFDWIGITWGLTEEQIRFQSGDDAVLYLSYQRHLIFVCIIMTFISLVVIMPINLIGRNLRYSREGAFDFQETTMANVNPDSPMVWIHVTVSFLYFMLTVIVMRHFSRQLTVSADQELMQRSILLIGISRNYCHIEKIQSHFEEVYPRCTVEEVSFVYDTSRLKRLEDRKSTELNSIMKLQMELEKSGKRDKVWPLCCCARWCCCLALGCEHKVDAIRHYAKNIRSIGRAADRERVRTLNYPLGLCFVTFASAHTAKQAKWDYSHITHLFPWLRSKTPLSHFGRKMNTDRWIALDAPLQADVLWENFGLTLTGWYSKFLVINLSVFVVILIFSTPIIFIKSLESLIQFKGRSVNQTRPVEQVSLLILFHDVMPIFIIWVAAVTLPSLVTVSDRAIGFWSRTAENRSRMVKTFTFLMFMVVVLPSLGISSFLYFVDAGHHRLKLECIFSPVNGGFYVNYVSTCCFIGVLADLNRFPELFLYVIRMAIAKSKADIVAVRFFCLWDFQIGTQYAWTMIVFAVFTIFSITCPLIMPFGLAYMLLKNFVDKYNVFFATAPCKVDKTVHVTAINFVYISMFILQCILFAFSNRLSDRDRTAQTPKHANPFGGLQYYALFLFSITFSLFIGQIFFNFCISCTPYLFEKVEPPPKSPPWLKVRSDEAGMSAEDYFRKWEPRFPERDPEYAYRIPKVLTRNQRRFFSTIPRTIVSPDGEYWAPYLRKDFPFEFPGRKFTFPSDHSFAANRIAKRRQIREQEETEQLKRTQSTSAESQLNSEYEYRTANYEAATPDGIDHTNKTLRVRISIERKYYD